MRPPTTFKDVFNNPNNQKQQSAFLELKADAKQNPNKYTPELREWLEI
ncbi:hypothetical protein [Campylobacter fetus]|nr:hypothetical protein [Campylobacter fetus]